MNSLLIMISLNDLPKIKEEQKLKNDEEIKEDKDKEEDKFPYISKLSGHNEPKYDEIYY